MCKDKHLDFATIILLIMVAFILATYIVVAVWAWVNQPPILKNHWQVIDNTQTFNQYSDQIIVNNLEADEIVTNPLTIRGKARGTWFFEGSFPVELVDSSNNTILQYYATAQEDWMTEDWVPFVARLEFSTPATEQGTVILKRDNPSGLAEYDAQIIIPVQFDPLQKYYDNDLYCETDEDCLIQRGCCPCPLWPSNKYNIVDYECPADQVCTMQYCEGTAYCENHSCKMKSNY